MWITIVYLILWTGLFITLLVVLHQLLMLKGINQAILIHLSEMNNKTSDTNDTGDGSDNKEKKD